MPLIILKSSLSRCMEHNANLQPAEMPAGALIKKPEFVFVSKKVKIINMLISIRFSIKKTRFSIVLTFEVTTINVKYL